MSRATRTPNISGFGPVVREPRSADLSARYGFSSQCKRSAGMGLTDVLAMALTSKLTTPPRGRGAKSLRSPVGCHRLVRYRAAFLARNRVPN